MAHHQGSIPEMPRDFTPPIGAAPAWLLGASSRSSAMPVVGHLDLSRAFDQRIGCLPLGGSAVGGSSFREERPPEGGTPNPPVRSSVGQALPSCLNSSETG